MPLTSPSSEMRASDAERERVVTFLREHSLAGRLDSDELEERIGLAYSARYVGELERLIRDLPRRDVPARPRPRHHGAARARRNHKHQPTPALIVAGVALMFITGLPMVILAAIVAVVAVVVGLSFVLGPFLLIALLIVLASRRHRPPARWGRV